MPQRGTPIDGQTVARLLEINAELMLRLPGYPSPGWIRAAKASRDLLQRLRTMGDSGTYNAPNAAETSAYESEITTAIQEHKAHLATTANALNEAAIDDPADEEG